MRPRSHKLATAYVAAGLFGLAALASSCNESTAPHALRATTTTSLTSGPTAGPTSGPTNTSPAASTIGPARATVTTTVEVVVCATTFGVAPPAPDRGIPSHMTIAVPSSVAGRLAIYTDDQNTMEVVAPAGWTCRALYGADGSGGVVVFPAGEKVDDTGIGDGWHLTPASTVEVVVGGETSACGGCTTGQACPLFTAAARDYQTQFGRPCPVSRPTAETTDQISSGVKAFEDPPGVAGTGDPSGGVNPANGVMTYYGGNPDGSWAETCTLPPVDRSVCTVALNRFVTLYGTR